LKGAQLKPSKTSSEVFFGFNCAPNDIWDPSFQRAPSIVRPCTPPALPLTFFCLLPARRVERRAPIDARLQCGNAMASFHPSQGHQKGESSSTENNRKQPKTTEKEKNQKGKSGHAKGSRTKKFTTISS
jgi:hypothetical protein